MSEIKVVTTKTGFGNVPVIPVENIHKSFPARDTTKKWKENDYFIEKSDELTEEERSAIFEETLGKESTNVSVQDIYSFESSKPNKLRDELLSDIKTK